jgi:ATP-binding cassette subfamily B multidrug efflux pump
MELIFSYVRRHLAAFLTAVLFLAIEAAADLLQPTMMSFIVDKGVVANDADAILQYGAIMLAIALAGAIAAIVRNFLASRTSQTVGREMRSDLYRKVQTLSFENIDRIRPSSIVTRMTNDVTQVQNFINGCMRIIVKAPLTCIGAVVLIVIQTPQQAPAMIVILCIATVLIGANMKMGYPRYGILQGKLDRLNAASREFLSSIRVVKAFGAEEQERERFDAAAGDFACAGVSAMRVQAVFAPLINLTVNAGIIMLLWVSQNQSADQIGRLMASVNYMTQVLFALGMISNILNTAVRGVASSNRIREVLDEEPAQKQAVHPKVVDLKGAIAFESVSFAYAGSARTMLEHVDFRARSGETIGIIGPTGSGKTTLVNLVPRFYDATAGRILIDGCDVRDLDGKSLRNAIAIVPQKPLLFSGTVASNVRWGDPGASREEILQVMRISCADEFVMRMEDGLDALLGQEGINLSGGQKQRLCIARALLRKPRILILDDCTSALDATTEAKVLNGLENADASMTVLIISQRVSTVMRADRILCLDDGRVAGFGTHRQLMEGCATYRAFQRSQIGGDRDAG